MKMGDVFKIIAHLQTYKNVKWKKQVKPNLPCVQDGSKLLELIKKIKGEIYSFLIEGVHRFISTDPVIKKHFSLPLCETEALAWLIACILNKYGAIYFVNRSEIELIDEFLKEKSFKEMVDKIHSLITHDNGYVKIFNYAIYSYVHSKSPLSSSFNQPVNSIFSYSHCRLGVNYEDFYNKNINEIIKSEKPLYDLHDFVHYLCMLLDNDLFESKRRGSFLRLPDDYKNLILSSDFLNPNSIIFSDNLIFRQISLGLFDNINKLKKDEIEIVSYISNTLFKFYIGECECFHPNTKAYIRANRKMNVVELAVLSQNKIYEHSASEIEEQVFIRGGSETNLDPLHDLSIYSKVEKIKNSYMPFYYERRNYLRHRACKESYVMYAEYIIDNKDNSDDEKSFAKLIIDNLTFNASDRDNLFNYSLLYLLDTNSINVL